VTEKDLEALLSFGREQRSVEFKGPGSRADKTFLATVVRAMLGMANQQDGGVVVIGVDEGTNRPPTVTGLSDEDLATWNHDHLSESLAQYADPFVSFELDRIHIGGHTVVVISVAEFEDVPILCKRNFASVLRDGACYVRSRRKVETVDVPTHADMRQLLELATNKAIRKFLMRAQRVGMAAERAAATDAEQYDQQLGDLK
jgi:predicted HTH transcriptional regulator